jgi:hypothetical protein
MAKNTKQKETATTSVGTSQGIPTPIKTTYRPIPKFGGSCKNC